MRINMRFIITMLSVFERCPRVHFLLQTHDDTGGPFRFRITSLPFSSKLATDLDPECN